MQSDEAPTKAKTMGHTDDDDAFVIYQPASWSAKRPKLSAARMAYTFDWKTDVFGPSPNAVRGQRTKYPKPPAPTAPLVREVGPPIQHSILLRGMLRDRAGSLASMSDVSSFASTGEDELDSLLITPLYGQVLPDVAVGPTLSSAVAEGLNMLEHPISPTGAVVEQLSNMGMVSPDASAHSWEARESRDEELDLGSAPHTPLTPRSVPDSDESDEDSDDD